MLVNVKKLSCMDRDCFFPDSLTASTA